MLLFFAVGRPEKKEIGETHMKRSLVCAIMGAVAASATTAIAEPLGPGDTLWRPGTPAQTEFYSVGAHGGIVQMDSSTAAMHTWADPLDPGLFFGTFTSEVWTNASGGLTFVYQLTVGGTTPPQHAASRVTIGGDWRPFDVSAGSEAIVGGQVDPTFLRMGALLGGLTIDFTDPMVEGGESSTVVWFETDASHYTTARYSVIDAGLRGGGLAFVVIPLPSAGLMGLAGIGLIAVRRRNR